MMSGDRYPRLLKNSFQRSSMKKANFLTSSCRYCRYYQTEGRRGGTCQQLGGSVQANWKACTLAAHPFGTPWEQLGDLVHLESSYALEYAGDATDSDSVIRQPVANGTGL
jgi:hypothetical protein